MDSFFSIFNKQCVATLSGKSGSGKSTLAREITQNNKGIIYISNKSMIFEGGLVDNIVLDRIVEKNRLEKIITILKLTKFKNLSDISQILSTGEQQRVVLARGLLSQVNHILFDELTTGFEETISNRLIKFLLENKFNYTLFITHQKNIIDYVGNNYDISKFQ